ncbi:MAG: 2-amino-4-hydroxy-6-hydroxymethyldihydropteridine diphosphokinase, partial [Duncaniella sp.]|nr:2-amino-4-hydroxy-6-hydroxymethyldihydropteridine diphosphokinase [Duncaniella sp.]
TAPHRDRDGGYIDRRIDIDIIAIDSIVLSTPRLTLPHPRMHLREFVLVPLAQLAPGWVHPVTGLNASAMLARLT